MRASSLLLYRIQQQPTGGGAGQKKGILFFFFPPWRGALLVPAQTPPLIAHRSSLTARSDESYSPAMSGPSITGRHDSFLILRPPDDTSGP